MIKLDENELEMAMITYNRAEFVEEWLLHCLKDIIDRNIRLIIYDSSTDGKTKELIGVINKKQNGYVIQYEYISPDVWVGHVVLTAIMKSKSKYVWVVGDSRYHDFKDLDDKVFPAIKADMDHIVLHILNNDENDGKVYENREEMLSECFVSMTCTGLYIYKTEIFRIFNEDRQLKELCEKKYLGNYAFTWIGYFLEAYARQSRKTQFLVVPVLSIMPKKKIQRWYKKFYGCWCGDLCDLMIGLSEYYHDTDTIIRQTWIYNNMDAVMYCYDVRNRGDLERETYDKYDALGYWQRCTDNTAVLREFAYAKDEEIDCLRDYWGKKEKESFYYHCKKIVEQNIKKIRKRKICIYGAGIGGSIVLRVLREYGIEIKCFYDQAYKKTKLDGINVLSPSMVQDNDYIVVSLMNYRPVKGMLKNLGIPLCDIIYPKETWGIKI